MNLLNQFSYVFISLGVVVGLVLILWRLRVRRSLIAAIALVIVAASAAGWWFLRPGASDVDSVEAAEAAINNGRPTFVEFYSNYCAGCLAVRPVVDQIVTDIEDRYDDRFNILRVDIHTSFGRALRERYGFSFTPEFVLFDQAGKEVWRAHVPPSSNQIEMAARVGDIASTS